MSDLWEYAKALQQNMNWIAFGLLMVMDMLADKDDDKTTLIIWKGCLRVWNLAIVGFLLFCAFHAAGL